MCQICVGQHQTSFCNWKVRNSAQTVINLVGQRYTVNETRNVLNIHRTTSYCSLWLKSNNNTVKYINYGENYPAYYWDVLLTKSFFINMTILIILWRLQYLRNYPKYCWIEIQLLIQHFCYLGLAQRKMC